MWCARNLFIFFRWIVVSMWIRYLLYFCFLIGIWRKCLIVFTWWITRELCASRVFLTWLLPCVENPRVCCIAGYPIAFPAVNLCRSPEFVCLLSTWSFSANCLPSVPRQRSSTPSVWRCRCGCRRCFAAALCHSGRVRANVLLWSECKALGLLYCVHQVLYCVEVILWPYLLKDLIENFSFTRFHLWVIYKG